MSAVRYEQIRYEVSDPVATITLDRPEQLNAWTQRMGVEVRHAIHQAASDPAVVGIVITGAGRGFCAGADMNMLSGLSQGSEWGDGPDESLAVPADPSIPPDFAGEYTYLLACPKPILAAINGPIAGMAVPIALCCDVRFMAPEAVFVTSFAERGLIAEWGLSWLLPRLVGSAVALDLLFSSRKVRGEEAARLGLVNEVVPGDELLARSRSYIEDIAARCSPTSIALMKGQVYRQLHAGLGPAEAEAQRMMVESFSRPDFAEGVASFMQKRSPKFERYSGTS